MWRNGGRVDGAVDGAAVVPSTRVSAGQTGFAGSGWTGWTVESESIAPAHTHIAHTCAEPHWKVPSTASTVHRAQDSTQAPAEARRPADEDVVTRPVRGEERRAARAEVERRRAEHEEALGRRSERPVHRMYLARPGRASARRYGLNMNHHVRVWCECMSQQRSRPGELPNGPYYRIDRSEDDHAADPRRLGGWDWLGVADSRVANSALDLFRAHVEREEGMTYEQAVYAGRVYRRPR